METILPVNAQISPRKESPTRNTDVLIASFTGSGQGKEKNYLFHHKDCNCLLTQSKRNKFHLATGEPTCTRSEGDMYKNL